MDANGAPAPETVEKTLRTLRHDVGDFLQSIYAAVAVLQVRLPAEATLERTVLGNLRGRAEACRTLLDIVQDFLGAPTLTLGPTDLGTLTRRLVETSARLHPHLEVVAIVDSPPPLEADVQRLAHLGGLLLGFACDGARGWVALRAAAADGGAMWEVTDDGPALSPEELGRVFEPFVVQRPGRTNLGLAPAAKIVRLHGGRIGADSREPEGLRVWALLPTRPPGTA
jgi:signal transduction histidine kinase